ncbi:VTT domain-containing protein [Actinoplanes sp. RD1]|uniref:VTT domain-containing protein n=1 Tax=Actinoplanes sp. RD1 TaxID=3064538 RepID=UPI00274138EF|nr:VTT domain-containing protein [Actinoplanes sp. RD1]
MTTYAAGFDVLLDAEKLITAFGVFGILGLVFFESGILISAALPFLPGDSLLFTTGLLLANDALGLPLWLMCLLISVAAVAGDQVGYVFGRKVGTTLFNRPNSRFFKQENAQRAHDFFERRGARSIILARFIPMFRTLVPIMAGVGRMNYRDFLLYNIIGGLAWGTGLTLAGYFLGQIDVVADNLEKVLLLIILASFVPVVLEIVRGRRAARAKAADPAV